MTQYMVDMSHYDRSRGDYSLAAMHGAGIEGATHKVTEGTDYVDPDFSNFGRQFEEHPLAVGGSYHVAYPGRAKAQADYWVHMVDELFPHWRSQQCWIWQSDDEKWAIENGVPIDKTDIQELHHEVLELIKEPLSTQIAYCPEWVYGDSLAGLGLHLWASNYGNNPVGNFKSEAPRDDDSRWDSYSGITPSVLQFGSNLTVGHQHECDVNAVRVSTPQALQRLFNPASAPSHKPSGVQMWPWPSDDTSDCLGNINNPSERVHGGAPQDSAAVKAMIREVKLRLHALGYRGFAIEGPGLEQWGDGTDAAIVKWRKHTGRMTSTPKLLGRVGYYQLIGK